MRKCIFCKNGKLTRSVRPTRYRYKGKYLTLDQPGEFCDSCDEGILDGNDLASTSKQLHDWHARVDGLLTSSEIRRIRKKLGLTQAQAADLCGGGHNAFSRYENGESQQLKATDNLLRLLDRHPELLAEIRTKQRRSAA